MDTAPFFSRAPLRQLFFHTATVVILSAAATAHATNDGLWIYGEQMGAIAGQPYTFTPQVSNPSGRPLTFGIVNKPSWATLNTKTGQLSGRVPNVVTTYNNISISVTDGVSTVKTASFNINAHGRTTWDQPILHGTPAATATAGSLYSFQPSAADPYGEPLSFSVKNKPAWASFSIATGRLYGTPTSAQDGTYANIVISVNNGEHSTALPAFSITVQGGTTSGPGSATLSWKLPTENTNGSALTNLAGIRIYYGVSAANLNHVVQVASLSEDSYAIGGLTAGTWYFAAKAYTNAGTQSAMSSVVTKSVQ